MTPSREQIADALARTYDGQPLAELRDEHAALHLEAADAVLARLTQIQPDHTTQESCMTDQPEKLDDGATPFEGTRLS
ncbi:hypothetical protein [Streptomyces mexicanus]|uniref:hypothetical protein n=1 Tax=Streptomyces mexicanus TaxID=178566 RepID=UPI0036555189